MSDLLQAVDLSGLTMEDVRAMKNQAISRLKAAGQFSLHSAMHQNGINHNNHGTSNGHTFDFTEEEVAPTAR